MLISRLGEFSPDSFTVVEGHFNQTPLAGLKWAALYKWPGEIAAGNGTRLIVIDERADEAQRIAILDVDGNVVTQ